jgi:hypothetical protein
MQKKKRCGQSRSVTKDVRRVGEERKSLASHADTWATAQAEEQTEVQTEEQAKEQAQDPAP